jgi:PAS domain S-box-containing protein
MQVPHDAEYRAKHKNGDVLWVVETIYPSYSPDGIIEASLGKIVDITERKHGEEKLRQQAQILEQVHDIVICTDLDGYVLSWDRGAERVYGYSAEEAPGKHMSFMYQEEQGKHKNSFHQQVAKPLLEKVRSQSSIHHFRVDLPKELPLVYADQLRLERIPYNLLENAVKYSPQGGKIRVSVRTKKEHLLISVSDQGIGISPSDQAKLFGPFQRLEDSRPEGVGGVELGLLVCRRLVEAHGGRIWVKSEPGRGSTFFFTMPLRHS